VLLVAGRVPPGLPGDRVGRREPCSRRRHQPARAPLWIHRVFQGFDALARRCSMPRATAMCAPRAAASSY
jgi:hypothetical protein